MLPFYVAKTLLFYNKTLFKEAGLAGPPQSFDEILTPRRQRSARGEKTGFLTLNFDWLYWPLFKMNGIELLIAGSEERRLQHAGGDRGADGSPRPRRAAAINKISWTGRWVEPNGAFASGTVGMLHAHSPAYFFIKGQGPWINERDAGRGADAGQLGDAQQPRLRHLQGHRAIPSSRGSFSSS